MTTEHTEYTEGRSDGVDIWSMDGTLMIIHGPFPQGTKRGFVAKHEGHDLGKLGVRSKPVQHAYVLLTVFAGGTQVHHEAYALREVEQSTLMLPRTHYLASPSSRDSLLDGV